jgi:hypothetical protein
MAAVFSHSPDFSVAKGYDKSNIFFSMGYDNENGILIENTFKRYSLRLNSDFELAKWAEHWRERIAVPGQ